MTASLYQSGSPWRRAVGRVAGCGGRRSGARSVTVTYVELGLAAQPPDGEDVAPAGRAGSSSTKLRPPCHSVASRRQQVVHLVASRRASSPSRRARSTPAPACALARVEVHDDERRRREPSRGALRVAEQLRRCRSRWKRSAVGRAGAPGARAGSRLTARSAARALSASSRSQWRSWYFSESRYSSLPGSRGALLARARTPGRRCRSRRRASRPGRAGSRTPGGRRAAGARGGCRACWARRSAGRSR